jgi:hypothetical protein
MRLKPLFARTLTYVKSGFRKWLEDLSLCCDVVCGFSRGIDGAKRQSMTSVGEVTEEEGRGRKCFIVRPAWNRAGELSLMRRVWYHNHPQQQLSVAHVVNNEIADLATLSALCSHLCHAETLNEGINAVFHHNVLYFIMIETFFFFN